eukprot:1105379-Prymnesium_polylepis.1
MLARAAYFRALSRGSSAASSCSAYVAAISARNLRPGTLPLSSCNVLAGVVIIPPGESSLRRLSA